MAHRYVLVCVVFIFCRVDGETQYGLKGKRVSLKPNIPDQPMEILWKHNGNKLVEFDGKEEHLYGKFQNRTTLDWHNADILITDLRFEDSGNYELEVFINNRLHSSSKTLVVIDEVPEPTISCKMNDGSSSNKSGTLECSAESKDSRTQSLMKFQWESRGNVQPGPQLTISLGDEHDDHVYTCNVRNPMSSKTTTFTAKDCYPDESSSVALAAGLAIPFLIIFVVLGIVFCCNTRTACFAVKGDDEEKQLTENVSDNHETTFHVEESQPLLHTPAENQTSDMTGLDMTTALGNGESQNVDEAYQPGKAPPVRPRSFLSRKPVKKEDPADEPADLQESETSQSGPDDLSTSVKGEADEDQDREPANKEGPQSDSSDSEKENEPDQADVSTDTVSHPEPSSTAPEEPGSDQTTAQDEENSPPTDEAAASPPPDMTTGSDQKMNKGKPPPVRPRTSLSSEPAKKEDPTDEPADLQEDTMPHQGSSAAPEEPGLETTLSQSGSDQTTAQDEENSPPTDEAAASPPPDMTTGSDQKMNKGKAPPVRPCTSLSSEPAKKEDPADEPADLQENEMSHQESSTAPEEPGLETTPSESGSDQTTAQDEENSPPTDEAAASPPPDMTTGSDQKMNKGKPPPVRPHTSLSSEPVKKEDPADEPADLQENEMSHQESSAAPEEPGSDQTTAQDEENTDEATTDQQLHRKLGYVNSVKMKFDRQHCEKVKHSQNSDQLTAQDEENSDDATTDQQPDGKLGYVNLVKRRFQ